MTISIMKCSSVLIIKHPRTARSHSQGCSLFAFSNFFVDGYGVPQMPYSSFTFSYMICKLHRLASRSRRSGVKWSDCGKRFIVTNINVLCKSFLGKDWTRAHGLLNALKRRGFIFDEKQVAKPSLCHPHFMKGRKDLLGRFTYKSEFCWAQEISQESPQSDADRLALELFDLGMSLHNIHRDCQDLNSEIQSVFRDFRLKISRDGE